MRRAAALALALLASACSDTEPGGVPATTATSTAVPSIAVTADSVSADSVPPTTVPADSVSPTTVPADSVSADSVSPTTVPSALDLESAIRDALEPYSDVPGVAVAVIRDGTIVAAVGVGVDPSSGENITSSTRFQVGSISKPVAAVTAATLVEVGTLGWDADIHDALTSYTIPTDFDDPPTLAQLLSHTSGATVDGFLGYAPDADLPTVPDLLAGQGNSEAVAIRTPPGSWAYSGGGYTAVQLAMSDVTDTAFADLVADRVLEPLGMTRSTYAQPLPVADLDDDTTAGSIAGAPFAAMVHPELAAAGLWSTAEDLAAFLVDFQAALDGRSDVITAETASLMITPVSGGPGVVVGRGWFVDFGDPVTWFWHSGRNVGFSAELIGSVDGRHGVAVLTNALDAGAAIAAVIQAVSGLEGWEGLLR